MSNFVVEGLYQLYEIIKQFGSSELNVILGMKKSELEQ